MLFTLLGSLAFGAAIGQQADGPGASGTYPQDTSATYPQDHVVSAEAASGFHLRGILITQSSRAAMLNGEVLREGDFTNGAEILAIGEREVRIRIGSEERSLRVGSTVAPGQSRQPAMHIVRNVKPPQIAPEQVPPTVTTPVAPAALDQARTLAQADAPERVHPVKQGETLSGIAENYVSGETTRNQVVIALFRANPQAFSGNINALRAGAVLRIPDEQELQHQSPDTATAEVVAQTDTWRSGGEQPIRLAEVPSEDQYGPVNHGETLSGIAEHTLRDGITMDQMMIALFEANPQAFNGNINILHEGAILRIPGDNELLRQARDIATADVVAQTDAWRSGSLQQARSRTVLSRVTASNSASVPAFVPPFE